MSPSQGIHHLTSWLNNVRLWNYCKNYLFVLQVNENWLKIWSTSSVKEQMMRNRFLQSLSDAPTKTANYGRGGSVGYTGPAFGPTSGSPVSSIGSWTNWWPAMSNSFIIPYVSLKRGMFPSKTFCNVLSNLQYVVLKYCAWKKALLPSLYMVNSGSSTVGQTPTSSTGIDRPV